MSELDKNILKLRQKLLLDTRTGYLGNGSGEVHDRRYPGRYYVRFSQADGGYTAPVSILANPNANLPTTDGLPVDIGYDASGQMIIIRANVPGMMESGYNTLQLNPLDQQTTALINQTQITTFYATRHADLNNKPFTAVVFAGFYTDASVNLVYFPGGEIDLTGFQPTSPDHCYVVVFRKDDATLEAFASTPINVSDPLTVVDLQECLDAATANSERIWAWELRHDDTELTVDPARQIDLRTIVGSSVTGGGSGTVTSVAFTAAPTSVFDVTGSPITGSGTIALSMDNQSAHAALMGPTSGSPAMPAFRAVNGDDVMLPKNGSPTYLHAEDANTLAHSAGILDATVTYITQVDATHINVAAGKGWIRTSNAAAGQLVFFDWPASNNIAIPAGASGVDAVRYVGVEYNGGTPQVTVRTTFNWNWYDDFPLGRVSQDGTTLRILNAYAHAEDTASLTRRFLRLIFPFRREEPPEGTGGLVIGDVSGRKLSMSAGNVWHGFNKYVLSAIDTSGAGTFDLHYRNGTGGFTHVTGQTTWPNTQYDNNSGTLATMTAAHYANLWIYVDVSDGSLDVLYGRAEYTSVINAQSEAVPSTLPGHLLAHGRLLGRLIFQKSATSASLVESVWTTTFTGAPVLALDDLTDVSITSATKGNILVRGASDWVNLAVGTNGQVLTADSTASTGIAWKDIATSVTNSSGATANAGDVGYIDSTGVYKTTTTAGDIVPWAAVVTGGANTAAITVIRSGRITLNYTGSAPSSGDYLITSTTGGKVQAQAYCSSAVMAQALAAGSGGTVDALLLCNTQLVTKTDSNYIYQKVSQSTMAFVSTISGAPSTTLVTYGTVTSGNENVLPTVSTLLGKAVLWNTTRGTSRLITSVNPATNQVTTPATTDSWANGDTITIESQTVTTGQTFKMMEIDLSQTAVIPSNVRALDIIIVAQDTTVGSNVGTFLHPLETYSAAKIVYQYANVNNLYVILQGTIPIINRRFCVSVNAGGVATSLCQLQLVGYRLAVP